MGLIGYLASLDERVLPRLARGLRRIVRITRRVRPLTAITLLLVAAVVATAAWRMAHPEGGPSVHSTVRIGVSPGDLVPEYIAANQSELALLVLQAPRQPIYALVTFSTYLSPQHLADLVAQARVNAALETALVLVRVPVPRRQTETHRMGAQVLHRDVTAAMNHQAGLSDTEAAMYDRLAASQSELDMRALFRTSAELARTEAAAYRSACACIFAVVVRAVPTVLDRLAGHEQVRVVDAAPDLDSLDKAFFDAPLPEHVDRVVPLPDDSLLSPWVSNPSGPSITPSPSTASIITPSASSSPVLT